MEMVRLTMGKVDIGSQWEILYRTDIITLDIDMVFLLAVLGKVSIYQFYLVALAHGRSMLILHGYSEQQTNGMEGGLKNMKIWVHGHRKIMTRFFLVMHLIRKILIELMINIQLIWLI